VFALSRPPRDLGHRPALPVTATPLAFKEARRMIASNTLLPSAKSFVRDGELDLVLLLFEIDHDARGLFGSIERFVHRVERVGQPPRRTPSAP
jgi:hypothetical protein